MELQGRKNAGQGTVFIKNKITPLDQANRAFSTQLEVHNKKADSLPNIDRKLSNQHQQAEIKKELFSQGNLTWNSGSELEGSSSRTTPGSSRSGPGSSGSAHGSSGSAHRSSGSDHGDDLNMNQQSPETAPESGFDATLRHNSLDSGYGPDAEASTPVTPENEEEESRRGETEVHSLQKEKSLVIDVEPENKNTSRPRRVESDIIRIFLTYGILLFHLCLPYGLEGTWYSLHSPAVTNMTIIRNMTISEDPFTGLSLVVIITWFRHFMHAWNMPMFFLLSGHNAYSALWRRTETEFRKERVHRLFVPAMVVAVITGLPHTLSYFAPHENPRNETFLDVVRANYQFPSFHQAWFLVYLFLYSQMFTFWFRAFHPMHNNSETSSLSYFGVTSLCCTIKPFNFLTRFFCCMPATTPEEFLSRVRFCLGGPLRLAIAPGLLLSALEFINYLMHSKIDIPWPWILEDPFHSSPFFTYMAVFVLGYAMEAADEYIAPRGRDLPWFYLIAGSLLCSGYGVIGVLENLYELPSWVMVLKALSRGFGMWLLMIGLIAVLRKFLTEVKPWHKILMEMTMPFYLTHQQVVVAWASFALHWPFLGSFLGMLIVTTFMSIFLAVIITRSGPVRYFFGLPSPRGSRLPGEKCRGMVPVLVLIGMMVLSLVLANYA